LPVGLLGMAGSVPRSIRNSLSRSLSQAASAAHRAPGGSGSKRPRAIGASPRWPGVISSATGRPQPSTTAWIFVVRPPRERPIAWRSAPFSAGRRAMCLGGGAVDHLDAAGIGRRQRGKQLPPNPAARPTMKAIVNRRRRAIARQQRAARPVCNRPVLLQYGTSDRLTGRRA
jgi:hypothetical protein